MNLIPIILIEVFFVLLLGGGGDFVIVVVAAVAAAVVVVVTAAWFILDAVPLIQLDAKLHQFFFEFKPLWTKLGMDIKLNLNPL